VRRTPRDSSPPRRRLKPMAASSHDLPLAVRGVYSAVSPRSSLRIMRIASSMRDTKILPSPIGPVRAVVTIALITFSAASSWTTSSIFTFAAIHRILAAPRKTPCDPSGGHARAPPESSCHPHRSRISASFTASSRDGWIDRFNLLHACSSDRKNLGPVVSPLRHAGSHHALHLVFR